jgi:recombination protein RecA
MSAQSLLAVLERAAPVATAPTEWTLAAFSGRLAEISGDRATASLTLVFRLVLEAQRRGEPAAWIAARAGLFFPPDVAESGVDLDALAVVRAPGTLSAARAADHLLRSGGFGVVVLDLGTDLGVPLHAQTRLAGLAKQHGTALVCLTENDASRPSLGSLVSLRAHTAKARDGVDRFRCEARILKDKRRGPGWKHAEVCRGPDGVC